MKKIKQRRRFIVTCILIIIAFSIGISKVIPKNYQKTYEIDGYYILEEYHKNTQSFEFTIKKDNKEFKTAIISKFLPKKKHIKKIETLNVDNESCLKFSSDQLLLKPVCEKNEEQISHFLVNDDLKKQLGDEYYPKFAMKNEEYEKLKVYALLNHKYFIYNYKGFKVISEKGVNDISLFSKDIYDANLITKVDKYIFIPDYDSEYYFQKVKLLNMENENISEWNLTKPIYFDSVILGSYNGKLYLVDKHEKSEWELDLEKKKMKEVSNKEEGIIYQNGWQEKSMTKLINEDNTFIIDSAFSYEIDEYLYQKINDKKILISFNKPDSIISQNEDEVFYLKKGDLYCFSNYFGEIKLINNFEWNFNATKNIFVY